MHDNIIPGAEPFFFPGNHVGVLVCHGFTGSPQSMRYLGQNLGAAGYTVIGPRLQGHGVSPEAMAVSTAADWIASVDEALDVLRDSCSHIFMTGLSMGGTLALHAAARHAGVMRGVIPINATVHVASPDLARLAFDRAAPATVPGIGSDIKAPGVRELAYPEVPTASIRELFALVGVTRALLPRVTCPALVIQSRDDHVVEPANGPRIVRHLGSRQVELLWLENSFHVATLDHDRDLICRRCIDFIGAVAPP